MKRTLLSLLAASCAVGAAQALNWVPIIDTGFEDYNLGPINGQFGWVGDKVGNGTAPVVFAAPEGPTIGNKAVRLEVGKDQNDGSYMEYAFNDLIAQGYKHLYVSFDVYRLADGTDQNLWWWLFDNGEPTYGLQWDIGGTAPHGWNPGAGSASTIFGRYATVAMEWDLENNLAYSWYDGAIIDNGIPVKNITSLTGWTFWLSHDAASGNVGDIAYIDNFKVLAAAPVPEPATLTAVGVGLLLALKRRRK